MNLFYLLSFSLDVKVLLISSLRDQQRSIIYFCDHFCFTKYMDKTSFHKTGHITFQLIEPFFFFGKMRNLLFSPFFSLCTDLVCFNSYYELTKKFISITFEIIQTMPWNSHNCVIHRIDSFMYRLSWNY